MKITFRNVIIWYLTSLVISAWLFSTFEGKPFFDGLYWSCVTSTTTGYGDLLPTQPATKILFIVASHFWVFFCIPCVIALLLGTVIKNMHQFSHEEQEWQEDAIKALADKLGVELPPAPDGEKH